MFQDSFKADLIPSLLVCSKASTKQVMLLYDQDRTRHYRLLIRRYMIKIEQGIVDS